MIHADSARSVTTLGLEERRYSAIKTINDGELKEVFAYFETVIRTAASRGYYEAEIYYKDLHQRFPDTKHDQEWYNLLRDLGYTLDPTMSANYENQRLFIKWE